MQRVETILRRIERHKERLSIGNLFQWMSNDAIDGRRRLNFTPSMLYYLMGFKDVLAALYRKEAKTDVELAINAYCGEDAEHWRWFLEDLEKLGFDLTTWGKNISEWCNEVWSPSTEVNRKTIFHLVHGATECRDPIYSLALIWVFEATGVVFIGHTRKAAVALGMDDELNYFGRVHFEEEFGHSVVARDYAALEIDDHLHARICDMVDTLFNDYANLFECWYQHRDRYEFSGPIRHAA
jgi:hypothetical protein